MRVSNRWLGGGLLVAALASSTLLFQQPRLWADKQPEPVTHESSKVFRSVVKKVLPAVVSIETRPGKVETVREESPKRQPRDPRFDQLPPEFRRFFERFGDEFEMPQMPERRPAGGFGSGVIISPEGVIVTNNHVVRGADKVAVILHDGRRFETSNIARDPKTDLAIVRLDAKDASDLPVAPIGDSGKSEIGDWVLAMGSPFGLTSTVTAGIISAKGRAPAELDVLYKDFIQTDAAINPGNSGGPIVNLDGEVIGINTAIRSNSGTFGGVGFAIPSNMVKEVVDHLVKHGKVKRGYLGIGMHDAPKDLLNKLGQKSGVVVNYLSDGDTPARKGGLIPTDVIVAVDGQPVDSKKLQALVTKVPVGKTLKFDVLRDGKTVTLPVTIAEQPEDFGVDMPVGRMRRATPKAEDIPLTKIAKLGIEVEPNPAGAGVKIAKVDADGPMADAGVLRGAIITHAENKPVTSAADLEKAVASVNMKTDGVLLKVTLPDGGDQLIVVKE